MRHPPYAQRAFADAIGALPLDAAGIPTTPADHEVTKSLYFEDPDGNGVDVYLDGSDAWRREP